MPNICFVAASRGAGWNIPLMSLDWMSMSEEQPDATARPADLIPILLIGIGLSLLLIFYVPVDGHWSGDQGAKFVQIQSLIHSRFADIAIIYPGSSIDPTGEFSPVPVLYTIPRDGHMVSIYSYPFAFICAGFFKLAGAVGLRFPSLGAALGILFISSRLGKVLGARSSFLLPWIIILATPVLFYSLAFWEHALAALAAVGCLMLAARSVESEHSLKALAAGFVAGLAFLVRPEGLFLGPAACVGLNMATPKRWPLVGACMSGWALGLAPGILMNMVIYGQPLGGGVAKNYGDRALIEQLMIGRGRIIEGLIFDRDSFFWLLILLVALGAVMGLMTGVWLSSATLFLSLMILALRLSEKGMFINTGLVASCPLLLLALTRQGDPSRALPVVRLLRSTCLLYISAIVLTAPNDGGTQWGPRYLLAVIAPLAVLALYNTEHLIRKARNVGRGMATLSVGIIFLVSMSLQVHSLRLHRSLLFHRLAVNGAIEEIGHNVVLTDGWGGAQLLAPLYFERRIFLLHRQQMLDSFITRLRAHDVDGFVFAATQTWSQDLIALEASGVTCREAANFSGALLVLDCRIPA
ncbi:MAG: hypothetical protein GY835_03290 [bacterium]|nr:hypothetical protein [bacterium]